LDNLHWQLSILSKSIHYKNLSAAADHVGLSQPQLSRIISRLESELAVVLLDRTVRRKSGWTPIAYKIADTYFRNSRKLTQDLQQLKTDDQMTQVTIGILEGLIPLASEFCRQILEQPKLHLIELNVYDLSELEERFEKDQLDLIFTCREPGRHKYRYVRNLGYQVIQKIGQKSARTTSLRVFSQFEYSNYVNMAARQAPAPKRTPSERLSETKLSAKAQATKEIKESKVVLSNSLLVRRLMIESHGGSGFVPSEVRRKKIDDADIPVYLIGQDLIAPAVWKKFEDIKV
jgi:hypothetical protein